MDPILEHTKDASAAVFAWIDASSYETADVLANPGTYGGDLIADILHWITAQSSEEDAARAHRMGLTHWAEERLEHDA
jgi:hypothetical protein